MKKVFSGHSVVFASLAFASFALIAAGCASSTQSGGSGGDNGSGGDTGSGGSSKGSGGSSSSSGGAGGSGGSSGGNTSGTGGSSSSSGGSSASSGGTTGGSGGVSSSGGSTTGAGGTSTSTSTGAPKTTADIIGPGGTTSGNPNGTHGDKWICLLNYPAAAENVTGAWFAYPWTAGANCQTLTTPAGGGAPLCFKGGGCTGATPGAGLGFSLCDVHGVNVATWPQMKALITAGNLSTTTASTFSQCNAGAKITSVNWTLASGSVPAGTIVEFADVADLAIGQVTLAAAGATSVTVPGTFDASKIARIKFQMNGAVVKTWDFCFQKLTLSYQ